MVNFYIVQTSYVVLGKLVLGKLGKKFCMKGPIPVHTMGDLILRLNLLWYISKPLPISIVFINIANSRHTVIMAATMGYQKVIVCEGFLTIIS